MAKYDRKILLPYLRNLYSMELVLYRLQRKQKAIHAALEELNQLRASQEPPEEMAAPSPVSTIVLACLGLLFFLMAAIFSLLSATIDDIFQVPVLVAALAALACAIAWWIGRRQYVRQKKAYAQYCKELDAYQAQLDRRLELNKEIGKYKNQLISVTKHIKEAAQLRRSLYSLNVIPLQYRTLPTARYLYEYFYTSKANDIDQILQIYAVEKIREQSDRIPDKQIDLILNQRMRIAQQMTSDPIQLQYYEDQVMELSRLENDPELRNQYIRMFSEDLNISRFFSGVYSGK